MTEISSAEQYFIELTNRARLDPLGEAYRLGIDLNDGLAPGTLSGEVMQVLSPNEYLSLSSEGHSTWMLDNDVFSHTGIGGSTSTDRMIASGYALEGSWMTAENLAFVGTTGTIDLDAAILEQHIGLFLSAGHRVNTLNPGLDEIGLAQIEGPYTYDGTDYNTSMLTVNFGRSGTDSYLTGVAYSDYDGDDFYSIGEGRAGVGFSIGGAEALTAAAGGYGLSTSPAGNTPVQINDNGNLLEVGVDFSHGNVKLDLVNGTLIMSSADMVLGANAVSAGLLGAEGLSLTGNAARNDLHGNTGDNLIDGGDGSDWLYGEGGHDRIIGGGGNDVIEGGDGMDRLWGDSGNDRLDGGNDDDVLMGGYGDDTIIGGIGRDTATYVGNANLRIDLGTNQAQNTGQGVDTLISIENIGSGEGNDTLLGNEEINVLLANGGHDFIQGNGGSDRIHGGDGDDRLYGDAGNDILRGDAGNDILMGGQGRDVLDGGAGMDTAIFSGTMRVNVDLVAGTSDDGGGVDTLISIENVGTAAGNDSLIGDDGANRFWANGGDDFLAGGGGDDLLVGGDGADVFHFELHDGNDVIRDFVAGEDFLSLGESFDDIFASTADAQAFLDQYASYSEAGAYLTFGEDSSIFFVGLEPGSGDLEMAMADYFLL